MMTVQDLIALVERRQPEQPVSVRIVQHDGSTDESSGTAAQLLDMLRRLPSDTHVGAPAAVALTLSYPLDARRLVEFGTMSFSVVKPPFWDSRQTMYHVPNGPVPPESFVVTLPA